VTRSHIEETLFQERINGKPETQQEGRKSILSFYRLKNGGKITVTKKPGNVWWGGRKCGGAGCCKRNNSFRTGRVKLRMVKTIFRVAWEKSRKEEKFRTN